MTSVSPNEVALQNKTVCELIPGTVSLNLRLPTAFNVTGDLLDLIAGMIGLVTHAM